MFFFGFVRQSSSFGENHPYNNKSHVRLTASSSLGAMMVDTQTLLDATARSLDQSLLHLDRAHIASSLTPFHSAMAFIAVRSLESFV